MNKQEIEKAIKNINYGLNYESCGNMVAITKSSAQMALSALNQLLNDGTNQEQICKINNAACVGYSNGKCVSIENCYGKEWRDTSE